MDEKRLKEALRLAELLDLDDGNQFDCAAIVRELVTQIRADRELLMKKEREIITITQVKSRLVEMKADMEWDILRNEA